MRTFTCHSTLLYVWYKPVQFKYFCTGSILCGMASTASIQLKGPAHRWEESGLTATIDFGKGLNVSEGCWNFQNSSGRTLEGGEQWDRRLEGWSNIAARLSGWRRAAGVILYVMDGPYFLPFPYRTGCPDRDCPFLRDYWISSCCYIVNIHNHPSWTRSHKEGMAYLLSGDDRESVKGTVSRDFLLLVFFMNQFPPSPRVSH
jgi:hypothetical protein